MSVKLGLAAAAATVLMAGPAAAACPVKVGIAYPTSVDWGKPIAETTLWVADMINEAGGVDGCEVETILRDTQTDPKVGVDAAKALVDLDKVQLLIGAVASGVTLPILTSVTVPAGVMDISCCSSSTRLTELAAEGGTKGLWFRTFATSQVQAALAAMIAGDEGYKKITMFYKNDDWGQDLARLTAEMFDAAGIEVMDSIAITDGQPSYRAEVTQALATQPDAIYLALYPREGISVAREWISLGGTTKMVGANALKSDEFREAVGMTYLGDFVGSDTASPRVDSATAFVDAYREKFGSDPSGPGLANAFDAAAVALLAYHAAGSDATGAEIAAKVPMVTDPAGEKVGGDVEGFKKALELLGEGKSVSFQGGTGAVVFDKNGDVAAPGVEWKFSEDGIEETRYFTAEDVNAFAAGKN
ncbi:ABC transporter substrate-binding protein [Acuticoccus sp. MNP-M23]|uniref:ABC transporter substrate-binding protein n=1 Tax=Acuticoccus sp. MNP-M23 TaxID=3072793 RepID=UPI0028168A38|nr:ABC transporter substrate-binding protein [Acuticoccus sp. MNP-M23]WMS44631.1 ABC transporter substrate-binding protein [Acuticoccus sp. MNP-M23]